MSALDIRVGDRRAAFDAPFEVYPPDTRYVSPMWSDLDRMLDPARNPLARDGHGRFEVFTAHRAGRLRGRIVACMHDASNARHASRTGQFGFFDCADEPDVAQALLRQAQDWLRERGAAVALGNFNLTAMQMCGVVTDGFAHQPYTDMMWSPPHIARLLGENGYAPVFPMRTFEVDLTTMRPEGLLGETQRAMLGDPDFQWSPILRRSFRAQMESARLILNAGFEHNPMFVPVSAAEYEFQAGEMLWILDPRLSVLVHWRGKPAGALVCIPDLNPMMKAARSRYAWSTPWHFLKHRLTRTRAVVVYYSIIPELHRSGLNAVMLFRLMQAAKAAGYERLGTTWIADENKPSLRQMERLGATPMHRLHLFQKALA